MAQASKVTTPVVPDPKLYLILWGTGGFIALALLGLSVATPIAIFAFLIYMEQSLRKVKEDEVGAAFSYGKPLVVLESGLHFLPLGLMQIRKAPRSVQQFQCPGEPEQVFKGDDKDPLPEGMFRAMRFVTGGPSSDTSFKDDLLNVRMTLTLSFSIRWQITNVLEYVSNYGTTEAVEKQLRDIGETLLAEVASANSAASFLKELPNTNNDLETKTQDHFDGSGVDIVSSQLISPDLSHDVSKALAGIPEAKAKAEQTKITAEGEKIRLTRVGEGEGAAQKAVLVAQAEGRKQMATDLGVDGGAVLASETAKSILDKTDVLIAGAEGGMKDVLGLVKGAQSALNSTKGNTP